MELTATGIRRQQNSMLYACPANPVQHVVFFQGDAQNLKDVMVAQEETLPWQKWCLENTCSLLEKKFPQSAIWIVRPSRMLRSLFSCYHNFVQSSLIGVPTYTSTYGCLPQLEALLKDAIQRVVRRGELDMDVRSVLKLPVILIGFSKGCVILNQIIHELVNYVVPYSQSLYRSRQVNLSQSTPSISSQAPSHYGRVESRPNSHQGQRSQPSSPSLHRKPENLSGSDLRSGNERLEVYHRSKRLASPEVTRSAKRQASTEEPSSDESPAQHERPRHLASPEITRRQERLASPEITRRQERLTSPVQGRTSPEPTSGVDPLPSPEVPHRLHFERSRSRLSSTSSTRSERGCTPDRDFARPIQPYRSSSFGASISKHIVNLSESDIRNLTSFLKRIKAFYWLDAGHSGGHGAWVTDSELLNMFANLGVDIFVHVTPQQIYDPHRQWIGEEEREFVDKLRAFRAAVHEKVHFEHEERSLEKHFRVLNEF